MDIKLPLITGRTVQEQVQQIVSYLVRLARQLQQLPESTPAQVLPTVQTQQSRSSFHRLQVAEDLQVGGKLQAESVNGFYMQTVRVWGVNEFCIRSRFPEWSPGNRQGFLIAGCMDNIPLLGVIRVSGSGSVTWSGTTGVTVTTEDGGIIRVKLEHNVYDYFMIQSPLEFTV